MIKKYGNKILTSVSFTGIAISNVKADPNAHIYVNIGGTNYFDTDKLQFEKGTITNFDSLIGALAVLTGDKKLKKTGTADELELKDIKKEYFVKSVKIGNDEKLIDVSTFNIDTSDINDDAKKLTVELVKKEDVINISYDPNCKKVLTKAAEKELLESILQGINVAAIRDSNNVTKSFTFSGENQDSTKVIDKAGGLVLPKNGSKIPFTIITIEDGKFKTVVCKFATGVEENLVKGLNFEKYVVGDLAKKGLKISDVITALNKLDLLDSNKGISFFNKDAKLKALKDGDGVELDSSKEVAGMDFDSAKFIVLKDIKVEDINPIFFKKKFTVKIESDKEPIENDFITKLQDKLDKEFSEKVIITAKQIKAEIAKDKDNFQANAFDDYKNLEFVGLDAAADAVGDKTQVNNKNITIKIKVAAFKGDKLKSDVPAKPASISVKINTADIKKGDRSLLPELLTVINNYANSIKTSIAKADFITKMNGFFKGKITKDFVEEDFDFTDVIDGGGNSFTKEGDIKFTEKGKGKINDTAYVQATTPEPEHEETDNKEDDNGGKTGTKTDKTDAAAAASDAAKKINTDLQSSNPQGDDKGGQGNKKGDNTGKGGKPVPQKTGCCGGKCGS